VTPAVETVGEPTRLSAGTSQAPLATALPPDGVLSACKDFRSDEPSAQNGVTAGSEAAGAPVPVTIHRHGFLQAFQSLVYIIVIALFIITFTVQPFRIPSESMEPTLLVGDFLLVDKEVSNDQRPGILAPTNLINRGDLIVFHYPVEPSLHLVKRVVGLPGDHIRLHEGRVYIDGHAISEPYAIFRPSVTDSYRDNFPRMTSAASGIDPRWWIQMRSLVSNGELTVPADSYFVLGDNRNNSEDSRYWGFVPRSAIVGKPFLIYFSLKGLDNASGQLPVVSGRSVVAEKHDAPLGSLVDFARWDRALRIIH
jgi:signal peptidase I